MKALSADSLLARLLGKLAAAVIRYPRWFVYPQVALFLASIVYTAGHLQFDPSQDNLVGSNQKYHQNYLRYKNDFPHHDEDDLVVMAESGNAEKNRQFIERLGARMEVETNLFRDVFYKPDLKMMGTKALLLLPESDLQDVKTRLHEFQPFIQKFTSATNLVLFFEQINRAFSTASHDTNAESLVQALPVVERIVQQAADGLQMAGAPPSPGITALFNAGEEAVEGRLTFDHGRIRIAVAQTLNEDLTDKAIVRLRQLVQQTQDEVPGLNVGITGGPVLDYDQMAQSQKDTTLASIVSLILCALIFIYGYNETGRPVKATACLIVGLAYTLAFATLTVGHLNILTITFVPMLIGLAIDFGVHLITRYEEELRHGKTEEAALTKAMVFTGQGIFTGAATTAFAFLAMWLTDFKGIQEMGLICGGGLLVCFVPMMTLLPVLLLRGRQNVMDHQGPETDTRARIENLWLQRPVLVTAIVAALCALALTQIQKIWFDYDLLNLQSAGLPAVKYEEKLIHSADKSALFGAVTANSLDQAVTLEKRIRALPTVSDVDSIAGPLLEDQTKKLKLISQIKAEIAPLRFNEPDQALVDIDALSRTLWSLWGYCGQALEDPDVKNDAELTKQFVSLRQAIENLRRAMLQGDAAARAAHADNLAEFQRVLFADVRETFQVLQNQDDDTPLAVDNLPQVLRDRFVGADGKFLLQVWPKEDLWKRDNQKKFIDDVRTVDKQVTGTPVQLFEYESLLKNSYVNAAWYSLAAIAIMVFFHFRSFGAVVLSLLPVGIGTLWLAGLMGWFNVPFNPANIMTLPLVIGIGVTNGIQILNRFAEERTPNILARSTGKAVLVSGLTAIAGFGSLILAKHRGIHSLGCVMAVGITTCMIAGLTFLPALLNLLGRWHPLIKQPSVGKSAPTPGQEEPR
jgi:hypothetical protein